MRKRYFYISAAAVFAAATALTACSSAVNDDADPDINYVEDEECCSLDQEEQTLLYLHDLKELSITETFDVDRFRIKLYSKTGSLHAGYNESKGAYTGQKQKRLLNLYRWKNLISETRKVSTYEHFDDSYATEGATGCDGSTVSSFFAKIHKHLVAKYNNVRGRHYRQPIPTGLKGKDLGITPQNPGY